MSKRGNAGVPMICMGYRFFRCKLCASFIWHEIRRCVFHCCCVGGENVIVVVRSPPAAVHQPHAHTVTGTKARAWSTTAVVPLGLYYCRTAVYIRL